MGQMSAAAMGGTPAQVPCIGRNAAGVVKAIESMRRTGADMSRKYKQTSLGGLAVNVVTC
jgi:L-serine dehydratase